MEIPAVWIIAPLWTLGLLALIVFLRWASDLFIPIVLAVLVSYALYPVIRRLERQGLPPFAASALTISVAAAGLGLLTYSLAGDAAHVARDFPVALGELRRQLESRLGIDGIGSITPSAGSLIWQGSTTAFAVIGHVLVVIFLTFFFTVNARFTRRQLLAAAGDMLADKRTASDVIDDLNWQIQRFLLVRLVTAISVGVATWIALLLVGAPQAGLWGAFAGVFNSIPFFGPVIVSGGLAVVGLISGGMWRAVELAAIALVITSLEGWLITPPLLGRAARMNTVAVFLGLLLFGWMWGMWGTILALPMLAIIKSLADHIDRLRPVSRLLDAG
jgi:predicted PurR-regulated permease PerM